MGLQIGDIVPRTEVNFQQLKGKTLAVDAFNTIYQFLSTIRQPDGTPLMDKEKRVTSHLSGLFYRNVNLLLEGIKLVYVFDGEAPELKRKTIEKRGNVKDEAREKYEKAKKEEDIEGMGKYARQLAFLNEEMLKDSKELLEALGIGVVQAPSEGESQAAWLSKHDAYAVASQDYDSLLFGAPRLIQNLTMARKRKTVSGFVYISPEIIELEKVLNSLQLNHDQLICLGILVGSVDYNEPTIFKNTGTIKISPIGECPTDHLLEVPCFDMQTKKITFKKVKKYIKHRINKPLYEVITAYNRKVRVTKSHSLFVKKNNKIVTVKTPDLKKGDKLVVPVKIPSQDEEIKEINLAQELWKYKDKIKRLIYCDGKNIQEICKKRLLSHKDRRNADKRYVLTNFGVEKLRRLRTSKKIITTKTPLCSSTLYDWEKGKRDPTKKKFEEYLNFLGTGLKEFNKNNKCIRRIRNSNFEEKILPLITYKSEYRKTLLLKSLSREEVDSLNKQDFIYGRTRVRNPVPSNITISPELIRLVGYFLAEGHLSGDYRVGFSFAHEGVGHDDYCIKDVIKCIKKVFKTTPNIYTEKSTRYVCLDNCVIYDFFAYVLELDKQNSRTKKIPSLIFNISPDLQVEFLKGLFLGDGSLQKDRISFNTASQDLATGLSYIFLQQGIVFSTTFQNEKNYNMKVISICGKDQLLKLIKIWKEHHKAEILIKYCKKPLRERLNIEVDGDLGYVKIKSITKVKPSNSYVYDFSVDGENFIAGYGGVCCHNTDYNPGGVKGIGPKKALGLVREFKQPAIIFKNMQEQIERQENRFDWQEIFELFHKPSIDTRAKIEFPKPDYEKVKKILLEHDFSEERVDNQIAKLLEIKEKGKQRTLF